MNRLINVMVVDDQELFRQGLRTLLSMKTDIKVVGEAANGEEAVRIALETKPSVILMDLRMPVLDGVSAISQLKKLLPESHAIMLTTFDDDDNLFDGIRAGAVGYLLKDVSSEKLYEAIYAADRGEYFMMPEITSRVMAEFIRIQKPERTDQFSGKLSKREVQVLKLVSSGASNKEIADDLVITEGTVKNHLTSILKKLEVKNRYFAVIKAKDYGII